MQINFEDGQEVNFKLNKTILKKGGGGTSDYRNLQNKPKINDIELNGNQTSEDLGVQEKLISGENIKTINGESILGSGNIDVGGSSIEIEMWYQEEVESWR